MADDTKPRRGQGVTREQLAANRAAGVKRCFRCEETKPFDGFAIDKSRSDGLQPRCKACTHELYELRRGPIEKRVPFTEEEKKARRPIYGKRWRSKNKEKANQKSRDWMAANKESFAEYQKQWRAENAEREAATKREWKKKNKKRILDQERARRKANPEKFIAYVENRRARKQSAEGFYTAEDIVRIREQQKDRCAHPWCKKKLKGKGHRDHVIALKNGGSNWPENIQLLCASCNSKKGTKDPIKHAQKNGYLL